MVLQFACCKSGAASSQLPSAGSSPPLLPVTRQPGKHKHLRVTSVQAVELHNDHRCPGLSGSTLKLSTSQGQTEKETRRHRDQIEERAGASVYFAFIFLGNGKVICSGNYHSIPVFLTQDANYPAWELSEQGYVILVIIRKLS